MSMGKVRAAFLLKDSHFSHVPSESCGYKKNMLGKERKGSVPPRTIHTISEIDPLFLNFVR